jgi:SEC-C motif
VTTLLEAYSRPHRCVCDCHRTLIVEQRTQGVAAMLRFDDAMQGWGVTPLYEPAAPSLFEAAKMRADPGYRKVAVRDHACLYARFVGFAVHELIHAVVGEPRQANWGVPWGLPYGVPIELPVGEEAEFLFPYNLAEACAFVGVQRLARALYGIAWPLLTARDVGTYGLVGGRAIVPVPPGFRAIPHVDRQIDPRTYYRQARALEAQAEAYMNDAVIADWCSDIEGAEAEGRGARGKSRADPAELAAIEPTPVGCNEPCPCGSGRMYKRCCG